MSVSDLLSQDEIDALLHGVDSERTGLKKNKKILLLELDNNRMSEEILELKSVVKDLLKRVEELEEKV